MNIMYKEVLPVWEKGCHKELEIRQSNLEKIIRIIKLKY